MMTENMVETEESMNLDTSMPRGYEFRMGTEYLFSL